MPLKNGNSSTAAAGLFVLEEGEKTSCLERLSLRSLKHYGHQIKEDDGKDM